MMKHQVVISVTDVNGKKQTVLTGGEFTLRDRILNLLFGKRQRVLVLVPSEIVESVSIKEVERNETL